MRADRPKPDHNIRSHSPREVCNTIDTRTASTMQDSRTCGSTHGNGYDHASQTCWSIVAALDFIEYMGL
eukprot:4346342-Amphidinium_carterae.1